MNLVPELVDGCIVLNVENVCTSNSYDCKDCSDTGGALHNWLLVTGLKHVLIDLQDEKDICLTFLVELMQLRKRLPIPFKFIGAMDRPKILLECHGYSMDGSPIYHSPEKAAADLKLQHPEALSSSYSEVQIGEAVVNLKVRNAARSEGVSDEGADADL